MPVGALTIRVSGEYSTIMTATQDREQAMMESLLALERAGADRALNYVARRG